MPGKAKPEAERTSRTSKPRKAAAGSKTARKAPASQARASDQSASSLIDQRIRELRGWRGETLGRLRALILKADPEMIEEVKWVKPTNPSGVPVWSHAGIVCTGEVYKSVVKLTFAQGAKIADPARLFNSSLEGSTRRAIDIHEGDAIDESALKALVRAAVSLNVASKKK